MSFLSNIFGKRKEAGHHALALDVGTDVVKALVFKIEKGKGRVVGVGRQKQRLGDMQNGAITDINGVIAGCQAAVDRAVEMAGFRPDQVILGIAGELVKGTTTTVHYERMRPQSKIDLPELKNIVHKIQWRAFDQARKQLAWESGYSEIDVKLVNAAIVDVRIDGYKVSNPLGFQGKDVSIGGLNAFAPLVHLAALQTLAAELKLDLLSIVAEPYAMARSMGVEDASEFSAIFMDVGGGTTDIAVVRNGGVEGTKMFALGGRIFTKRLAQTLGVSFAEAEKIKIDYADGLLNKTSEKSVQEALGADAQVWLSGVELSLEEFPRSELLPSKILLCGGASLLPEIKKVLQLRSWVKKLPFAKPPTVRFMRPEDVTNIIDETGKLTDPKDITPMALANLAIDLAGEEPLLSSILRKVIKMMQT